jgi:hypothetical protein
VDEATPRFSLVSGEGDGAMLGLAAGDTAGGAWELGYSAHTEQATLIAYQLIEAGRIDPQSLVESMRELDGARDEDPVYRAESSHFRAWLDSAAAGRPVPGDEPSIDPCPRAAPIGVAYRRDAAGLVDEVVRLGVLFHTDAVSILGGGVVAAAVAASCFGQSGIDLIAGVGQTATDIVAALGNERALTGTDGVETALAELTELAEHIGVVDGPEALGRVSAGPDPGPFDLVKAGLLLAAPIAEREHLPVEQAARIGGSGLGAVVGAILGARAGIRAWPWAFANDTWFAEMGRRLVRGPAEVQDLPIPYAVEHHLMSGERPGFH